jgi:15-cis-phytoene synthase
MDFITSDPERCLAVAYAPIHARSALRLLWALDEQLAGAVARASEPGLAQIRLAWWRDALTALDQPGAAPPEPLLAAIAAQLLPTKLSGAELARLSGGWAAILDTFPLEQTALVTFAEDRGGRLFRLAGHVLAEPAAWLDQAGAGWALADLAHRVSDPATAAAARRLATAYLAQLPRHCPRALRSLGLLAQLAKHDAEQATRHQGSPMRLLRALWFGLSGR